MCSPSCAPRKARVRVVVMTTDDTPETMLRAVRDQAIKYVSKPMEPGTLLDTVREAIEAPEPLPIEVVSARPEWVEIVVPCTHEAADRIQTVIGRLETTLPQAMRDSLALAFRELLMNAIEWGGRLDPNRKVRIACLRSRRMLMYRIADPGPGFDIETLSHAAIGQPPGDPIAHMQVREEKGIRPGGFGLLMVRQTADELLYNEKRNEVVFVKYLDETSEAPPLNAAALLVVSLPVATPPGRSGRFCSGLRLSRRAPGAAKSLLNISTSSAHLPSMLRRTNRNLPRSRFDSPPGGAIVRR